jgi:hypothetical protein
VLLLVGLAATFGGLALHFRNSGHSRTAAAPAGSVTTAHGHNHGGAAPTGDGGLGMVNGLEMRLTATPGAGKAVPLTFQVLKGSTPQLQFAQAHARLLHFVLVNSDLSSFQHVHPTMDAAGTWTATVDLAPGTWRAVADSSPVLANNTPTPTVLAVQFSVLGERAATQTEFPVTNTAVVDGYTVTGSGEMGVGHGHNYTLHITKDGAPVTDIGEYVGAYGHLVAFDTATLSYTHLHPARELVAGQTIGPDVVFASQLPKDGRYKLFFQFHAGGADHLAPLVINVME